MTRVPRPPGGTPEPRPLGGMTRLPPSLGGRLRRDPIMMVMTAAFSGVQFVRGLRPPKIPPARPVSRDLPMVVTEVRREAEGVVSVRLAAPDGAVLPAWQPGSHLDVRLPCQGRIPCHLSLTVSCDRYGFHSERGIPRGTMTIQTEKRVPSAGW